MELLEHRHRRTLGLRSPVRKYNKSTIHALFLRIVDAINISRASHLTCISDLIMRVLYLNT